MMVELWSGAKVEVVESDMRQTARGVAGSATVRTGSGRAIKIRGRWDDPYKACREPGYEDDPAQIEEDAEIDGVPMPPVPPDAAGESRHVEEIDATIEDIADAIAKAR